MTDAIGVRETRSDRKRWVALIALVAAVLVLGLDMTILITALPTISARLGATESDLQWISGAYTLAMSVLLIPAGVVGDHLGRKKTLLFGVFIFGLGSVIASRVTTPGELIWMRAVMGIGAAVIMPLSMSILPSMFSEEERPRAVMIVTATVMLGLPLGPLVSGWLLTHFDWGLIFLINAPFVLAALLAVGFLVPETRDDAAPRLDWLGAALLLVGMIGLVYGIIEQPSQGWGDWRVWGAGLGGLLLLGAFVAWELVTRSPLIDLHLFTRPRFLWGTVAFTIVGFAMMGVMFVITPYFQSVQGASAQGTGLRLLPLIGGLLAGGLVSERLARAAGARITVTLGLVMMAGGLAVCSRVGPATGFGLVAAALALIGIGLGFGMPTAMDAVLGALPPAQVGAGSGISRAIQNVATTMGPAILGSILAGSYGARLGSHLRGLPAPAWSAAHGSIAGAVAVAGKLPPSVGRPLATAAKLAYTDAMGEVLLISAAVALVGAVLVVIFLPARAPESEPGAA
ncbi:MAG: MFS transporter [Candidatus Dormibacteraeota bacterium]|nr:MFS transporter [Candidatus Dormibacteraeota bacterium]